MTKGGSFVGFIPNGFPDLGGVFQVKWAPITLCPSMQSPERLVVAVVATCGENFFIKSANSLERLECLYGKSGRHLQNLCKAAFRELEESLAIDAEKVLAMGVKGFDNIKIEEVYEGEGNSLESVADLWMKNLSSLHRAVDADHLEIAVVDEVPVVDLAEEENRSGDARFNEIIVDEVRKINPQLIHNFSRAMLRAGRRRYGVGLTAVEIDYSGSNLVANFGSLHSGVKMNVINDIKRKILDLDLRRDSSRLKDARHEIIVYRPSESDPSFSRSQLRRVQEAVGDLAIQSNNKGLNFTALESVSQIGHHVVQLESLRLEGRQ